ncbi:MAG: 30S ribosomal protein S6 [Solirubrobacteraceae bacterium]
MADQAPLYDLLLLLGADAPEDQRTRILSSVESAISSAGGSVERNDDWGRRPMAYEIRHTAEAEYHLLQFRAPGALIEELSHTLRITDGVLRFRVIKVRPGTPEAKSSPPPVVAAVSAATSGVSAASAEAPRTSRPPAGGGAAGGDSGPAPVNGDSETAEEVPPSGDSDSE